MQPGCDDGIVRFQFNFTRVRRTGLNAVEFSLLGHHITENQYASKLGSILFLGGF